MHIHRIFIVAFLLCILKQGFSQNILLLEKTKRISKNYKYKQDAHFFIKTNNNEKINGALNNMTDSTLVINYNTVNLSDINTVYKRRVLVSMLCETGLKGSSAFIVIDSFNNLITGEAVFRKEALKAGGIMLAGGLILYPFVYKKCKIKDKHWRVRVLIMDNLIIKNLD